MSRCSVVGISGTTCSGKTTITTHLQKYFHNVLVLHQDDYFYDTDNPKMVKIWDDKLKCWNWESLDSLDMMSFMEKFIDMVTVHCKNASQKTSYRNYSEIPLIFVEGFTIYNYRPLASLIDLKFYLTLTRDQCYYRRNQRIYNPPDGPHYFDSYVWPCYLRMKDDIDKNVPDVIYIDGGRSEDEVIQEVLKIFKDFLHSKYKFVSDSSSEDQTS